tara:strand:+ start:1708 stop:2055 length:348 start_codon:yes stop_codon:yes gene_type:complete
MTETEAVEQRGLIRGIDFQPLDGVYLELDAYVEGAVFRDYENGALIQEYAEIYEVLDVHVNEYAHKGGYRLRIHQYKEGWKLSILLDSKSGEAYRNRIIELIENDSAHSEDFMDL